MSSLPNLGIDANDVLYCTFTQIDFSDGAYIFNTVDTYLCTMEPGAEEWSERIDCSHLGAISPEDSFHTFYTHITQDVPSEGPGIFWSQMENEELPASVHFNRPIEAPTSAGGSIPSTGAVTMLFQNTPNPFNPVTTITYNLEDDRKVSLSVYDTAGRLVKTLVDDVQKAGRHSVVWSGGNDSGKQAASGVYFYRLNDGIDSTTRKMVMVK
jgi:hypothetical protein